MKRLFHWLRRFWRRPEVPPGFTVLYPYGGSRQEEVQMAGYYRGIGVAGRYGWVDSDSEHFCFDPRKPICVVYRRRNGEYVYEVRPAEDSN